MRSNIHSKLRCPKKMKFNKFPQIIIYSWVRTTNVPTLTHDKHLMQTHFELNTGSWKSELYILEHFFFNKINVACWPLRNDFTRVKTSLDLNIAGLISSFRETLIQDTKPSTWEQKFEKKLLSILIVFWKTQSNWSINSWEDFIQFLLDNWIQERFDSRSCWQLKKKLTEISPGNWSCDKSLPALNHLDYQSDR